MRPLGPPRDRMAGEGSARLDRHKEVASSTDPDGLVDKLNKSRPLGAEDLWLIEQDLNQQLQAGAVAEPLSPEPLTNPLVNLDNTGGCGARPGSCPGSWPGCRSHGGRVRLSLTSPALAHRPLLLHGGPHEQCGLSPL